MKSNVVGLNSYKMNYQISGDGLGEILILLLLLPILQPVHKLISLFHPQDVPVIQSILPE